MQYGVTELDVGHLLPEEAGKTHWWCRYGLLSIILQHLLTAYYQYSTFNTLSSNQDRCSTLIKLFTSPLSVCMTTCTSRYVLGVEKRGWSGHQATKGLQHRTGEQTFRGPLPNSAPDRLTGFRRAARPGNAANRRAKDWWQEERCRCWGHKPYFQGVRADASGLTSCFAAVS